MNTRSMTLQQKQKQIIDEIDKNIDVQKNLMRNLEIKIRSAEETKCSDDCADEKKIKINKMHEKLRKIEEKYDELCDIKIKELFSRVLLVNKSKNVTFKFGSILNPIDAGEIWGDCQSILEEIHPDKDLDEFYAFAPKGYYWKYYSDTHWYYCDDSRYELTPLPTTPTLTK